jgi:hypothetical protein
MQDNRITRLEQERDRIKEIRDRYQRKLDHAEAKIAAAQGKCRHVKVQEKGTGKWFCQRCGADLGEVKKDDGQGGAASEPAKQNDSDGVPVREHLHNDDPVERPPV